MSVLRAWLRREKSLERIELLEIVAKHAQASLLGIPSMAVLEALERLRRYHGNPPIVPTEGSADERDTTRWIG